MRLTYVRWSMTMIEAGDVTIVTDPVFRMMGVPQAPRSFTFDRMPRPDLVFISHTHLDHFEPATLRKLDPDIPVWMPADKVNRARRLGLRALRGVDAWETDTFHGMRLTAVPARHQGGELGLVVEADRTVYFAGDTALDRELFRVIGHRWRLDAVLLPIGDLRMLGVPSGHIGPRKAAQALRLLGEPQVVVPTHYSGMTMGPLFYCAGKPRKLGRALEKAELGTIVGASRPLQVAEV
ncbi:MAG: MBL fold metallo-hydrolase [Anaerolineae bacterium]|nr:MBL fold metallo-hydrolase [Anaerolineae bacterium]